MIYTTFSQLERIALNLGDEVSIQDDEYRLSVTTKMDFTRVNGTVPANFWQRHIPPLQDNDFRYDIYKILYGIRPDAGYFPVAKAQNIVEREIGLRTSIWFIKKCIELYSPEELSEDLIKKIAYAAADAVRRPTIEVPILYSPPSSAPQKIDQVPSNPCAYKRVEEGPKKLRIECDSIKPTLSINKHIIKF